MAFRAQPGAGRMKKSESIPPDASGLHPEGDLRSHAGRQILARWHLRQLLDNLVPFWFPRAVDDASGGFLHCFDREGTLVDSDKSVWAQGRMAWMLLRMHQQIEANPDWLRWASQAIDFLERFGFDTDGRMFFHLTRQGDPIRKRRYAYSEAFAAIAWSALHRTTGDPQHSHKALQLFQQFVDWNFLPGRMPPKETATRQSIGLAPRMITLVTAQELREDLGDLPLLTQWIDRSIGEIVDRFVRRDMEVVLETVGIDGQPLDHFDGRLLNPGHALEGAWFLMREGLYRKRADWQDLGVRMSSWMLHRGWDQQHGGLFYFRDLFDKPIQEYWHAMKFWWPHNEAVLAAMLAYRICGDDSLADWHDAVLHWSIDHFADPQHGEWYGYLHRDGSPSSSLKGSLWKSFFHLPRMHFQAYRWLKEWPDDGAGQVS